MDLSLRSIRVPYSTGAFGKEKCERKRKILLYFLLLRSCLQLSFLTKVYSGARLRVVREESIEEKNMHIHCLPLSPWSLLVRCYSCTPSIGGGSRRYRRWRKSWYLLALLLFTGFLYKVLFLYYVDLSEMEEWSIEGGGRAYRSVFHVLNLRAVLLFIVSSGVLSIGAWWKREA